MRPLPPHLRAQLLCTADYKDLTARDVSDIARAGGARAAERTSAAAAMLGWHGGSAALPSQWCQCLVPGRGRTSISLYKLVTTIQQHLGVLNRRRKP